MKKMKKATIVALLVTVAYVLCLVFVEVPNEKALVLFFPFKVNVLLPFEVSPWWNLMLLPFTLILCAYGYSLDSIVGKEPRSSEVSERKFKIRLLPYFAKYVSLLIAIGTMIMAAFCAIILGLFGLSDVELGFLSILVSSIIFGFIAYVALGILEQFCFSFFFVKQYHSEKEESVTEKYLLLFSGYAKTGFLKSSPFLIGLTLAFILNFIIELLKKTKIQVSVKGE